MTNIALYARIKETELLRNERRKRWKRQLDIVTGKQIGRAHV